MNYRQFEVFVAVIECGSVTAAAEKLNLSQPAVSKSLKLLETELGIRLFLRGIKGLQATDEGRSLYLEASRMTDNYAHLEGFARNLPQMEHARLEISCMPALSIFWLPQATAKFIHSYPDATLAFRSRSSPETVQLVARGELDLGISQAPSEDASLEKIKLFDLNAVCILPIDHPLAEKREIDFADLNGRRIITLSAPDELQRSFQAMMLMRGHSYSSKIEISLGSMMCKVVEAGGGIGLVDEESARLHDPGKSRVLRFSTPISTPIYLLRNVNKPKTLVSKLFSEHIIAMAGSRDPG
ncbi:LysR family transcriptional regulator [Paenirhodobacter populi]|uniref:LysR family transcriptional regulator n=1 Tax=Paenirhodobacter populi TaxID=2306993 RepID=A0A443JNN1_9RHOB|nr:LysR family transcriptional regulator [Sinirhodobacter populi]RWR22093.1 LysR family transcriptional regulator [Sinirhodobacter populi]